MRNSFFKYIFLVFVFGIIIITAFLFYKQEDKKEDVIIDQTSKVSNIQTDLRLAVAGYDTINPILSNNRNIQEYSRIIFEPLITLDSEYKAQYCLAKEISKIDAVNYLIKIRQNVKWHDGTNFTSSDVKFTIDTIKNEAVPSLYKANLSKVSNLEKIDDYTIKLTLSEEVPFFEYNLTFPILSQKYYMNEDFNTTGKNNMPVGTGMFKIIANDENIIKLVKNEDYWDESKNPMLNEINITKYGTIGDVYESFKMGNIDIINVKTENIADYIGTLGYNRKEYKSREYTFIAFNTTNDILSNSAVRRAINVGIDKDYLIGSTLGNGYVKAEFPLDFGSWLNRGTGGQDFDIDYANQLIEEDGWEFHNGSWRKLEDGTYKYLNFKITVDGDKEEQVHVAENIAVQLANLGINISIRKVYGDDYYACLDSGDFELIMAKVNNGFSPNLNTFLGTGSNISGFMNDELFGIMNDVKNITDEATLMGKYYRIYEIFAENVPYVSLYRKNNVVICNTGLVGNITPNNFNIFHNIDKWYRQ